MNKKPTFLSTYLTPIEGLLLDPSIVEIAVNADGKVWIEKQGASHMAYYADHTFTMDEAKNIGTAIASDIGSPYSNTKPVLSGKILYKDRPLRAQILGQPAIEGGTVIALRAYSQKKITLDQIELLYDGLVDLDVKRRERAKVVADLAHTGDIQKAMKVCIEDRLNIMISGGTSSGKTTFARGLLDLVDPEERIVTIEDAFELFPTQPNVVALKAERKENSEVSAERLLASTLRLRPDRIILGELRGNECKTFLDAINTGHGGSFTTIHADTARKSIDRLALMVMSVGMNMAFDEVRRYCESSIDIVVQLGRVDGRRGVAEIYIPSLPSDDISQPNSSEPQ